MVVALHSLRRLGFSSLHRRLTVHSSRKNDDFVQFIIRFLCTHFFFAIFYGGRHVKVPKLRTASLYAPPELLAIKCGGTKIGTNSNNGC